MSKIITSLQKSAKHTNVLATQKGKIADVGNMKSKLNLETNKSSIDDHDALLQDERCPEFDADWYNYPNDDQEWPIEKAVQSPSFERH